MSTLDPAAVAEQLRDFALLQDASDAERRKLAAEGGIRQAAPDEVIMRQGDFGASMAFLLAGTVEIRARRFDGTEMTLGTLGPGSTFGELGLAGDRPRAATVLAREPCRLFEVDRDAFGKALGKNKAVIHALDGAYRRAAIQNNLHSDPLFADLPPAAIAALVDRATMQSYEKDDVIFEQGEEGDAFYLIWSGHVRITNTGSDGRERIFSYVAEGDYFGEMALLERRARTATVIANDHVEVIAIDRADFQRELAHHPAVMQRLRERITERSAQAQVVLESESRQMFISEMIKMGAAFASSSLVIDLGLCTRCGACAAACHDLYGNSRLTRRGATFVLPDSRRRILMPNSCWHCRDPECMKGCPTDALRRGPSGEIQVLADRCIGCKICANNCPWGNITMADPPKQTGGSWLVRILRRLVGGHQVAQPGADAEDVGRPSPAKAVKCDLCEGKPDSACVTACPYGAIARVDPNDFLRRALEV